MSKKEQENQYHTIAVLADIMEGKLTDWQMFLKHGVGIQTTIKLRKLIKDAEDSKETMGRGEIGELQKPMMINGRIIKEPYENI